MAINAAFLKTRVARRVLLLFFLCALLPLGVLALISYRHVSGVLNQQSRARLQQASKLSGMALLERLSLLERELRALSSDLDAGRRLEQRRAGRSDESFRTHFTALSSAEGAARTHHVPGAAVDPPSLSPAAEQHLREGGLVLVVGGLSREPQVLMGLLRDSSGFGRKTLWADVSREYLFEGPEGPALPPGTDMCVFSEGLALYCSGPETAPVPAREPGRPASTNSGDFEWREGGEEYVAGYWAAPNHAFAAPQWTVVLSESKANVLAPIARFKQTFSLTILLSLWVVLLLSNVQIRQVMEPLEKLKAFTRRIAQRDFEARVEVASRDEFQDLAASMNATTRQLGRQFNALVTINEIDRAILSQLDRERIVETVITRAPKMLPSDQVSVGLRKGGGAAAEWRIISSDGSSGRRGHREARLGAGDLDQFRTHPEFFMTDAGANGESYLSSGTRSSAGRRLHLVLPIFLNREPAGFIAFGYREAPHHTEEDLIQARQLADQVAVALSNSRLLEELERLNWGTLQTLARTIDAKSHWTAGHSERVTALSLMTAQEMGLSREQLDHLHRGGLLHDIGKIGIPPEILDKPARLTDEETEVMRSHVTVGARILAPLTAYAPSIPVVLYHHELWDGSGYPERLAGEAIPFLARVLTVPDVFDAVTSDRPYRTGWPREQAVEFVRSKTGSYFDPTVAEAFLRAIPKYPAAPGDAILRDLGFGGDVSDTMGAPVGGAEAGS